MDLVLSLIVVAGIGSASAQIFAAEQLTSFNSTFSLSESQRLTANFTNEEASSANNALRFDITQYAGGIAAQDAFYTLPPLTNATPLAPGAVIKVDDPTNLTSYALPPNVALSRILYTSLDLNDSLVPASAYILWPFTPRQFGNTTNQGAPVVLWNHPTSGYFSASAPSKHRSLFAGGMAPFDLALAGYAVVAPDYAGLGLSRDWRGKRIPHQYLASTASAKDAVYALHAARTVFPERMAENFAVMGQSQGGGVAWAIAELIEMQPYLGKGYLGTVAVSPTTRLLSAGTLIAPMVGFGLSSVFPGFQLADWLTPFGLGRAQVYQQTSGSLASALVFFSSTQQIVKENFSNTWEAKAYSELANAGRKRIKGPMLVIQGTEDAYVSYDVTSLTIKDTCKTFPENKIEYLVSSQTGHVPATFATRRMWTQWLEDRFMGKEVELSECGSRSLLESYLPNAWYQHDWTSFTQWAGAPQYSYEVPLAL
ncbi:hypothetical protein LTR37_020683 [Vermiconidia calcicola]|uniref:Uncharacterized protein n=1 Tax=Vermiconidia calcicola TaxID=1690605 RepID=A0ACC3MAQ3_9PEZI|nr:hypothetical protein LTR37_020683 [Vermiconidia calcicola]